MAMRPEKTAPPFPTRYVYCAPDHSGAVFIGYKTQALPAHLPKNRTTHQLRFMTHSRTHSLLHATLTLLMGGAVAQLVPLLLGPVLTRLFMPEAFGAFTSFNTIAATVAVVVCARYEFALPIARSDAEAATLMALCLRIGLLVTLLSLPLAAALHLWGKLPLPGLLPVAVASAGALQLLVMWNTRARQYRVLAISRVLQYSGAAALQLLAGWWLWQRQGQAVGVEAAWALVAAPVAACFLAGSLLLRPAPEQGWRAVLPPAPAAAAADLKQRMRQAMRTYRDFPLLNTPHAFLGTAQDALAVALLVASLGGQGVAAAGFWGLTLRYLKAPATLVGTAVSQALYPRLAAAQPTQARRMVRQVMLLLAAVALPMVLVLLVAGPWLFARVFGPDWREAGELARALAPYIGVHFVAAPLAVVTMAWQAQRWAFRWALVGQVAFVAALALGLRQGGLLAGAWAMSAAMMVYFGIYFWRLACWRDIPAPQSTMGEQS